MFYGNQKVLMTMEDDDDYSGEDFEMLDSHRGNGKPIT